jgi:hypothetical protein
MCRLQFLLWRTCLRGWRREDRLVLFFFNLFWTGLTVFLPKKENQICNSGDMMGYVVLINLSM